MRSLIATIATFILASCSSKETFPTSGGGVFYLSTTTEIGSDCPDPGRVQISATDETSGVPTLVVDGSDGGGASCKFDASRFEVNVGRGSRVVIARGKLNGTKGVDVSMTVGVPKGNVYTSLSNDCQLDVITADGGIFKAYISCPKLTNRSLPKNTCQLLSVNGGERSFIQFSDCLSF